MCNFCATSLNVRVEGLEPPCLAAPDPKSGTSTNFATPAKFTLFSQKRGKDKTFFSFWKILRYSYFK